ncbi:CRISPR-associated endonuclease Cas2 [Neisseria leonii]|uniref:CRISPR-associated endonuclease Cas2 n=1 Tax=Neisseria leonii TaxID=2995413 RepID=UPI00237B72E3|nr:CRISPR-associated endonuclease Cas2 [Neisseria sp. 3986]MDD9325669.1 CRISPR-associated endonuclease Cas2 [Neisseria sp. 3986]
MRWLIAYDIADTARLQRVYRVLCHYALPLQNSVFLLVGNQADYRQCLDTLLPKLNHREDDLRVYPLPSGGFIFACGRVLPEGVYLSVFESEAV